jgi:hypothetical protein
MTSGALPDTGALRVGHSANNAYLFETEEIVIDVHRRFGERRRSIVDAAAKQGVCFDASRWGKSPFAGCDGSIRSREK